MNNTIEVLVDSPIQDDRSFATRKCFSVESDLVSYNVTYKTWVTLVISSNFMAYLGNSVIAASSNTNSHVVKHNAYVERTLAEFCNTVRRRDKTIRFVSAAANVMFSRNVSPNPEQPIHRFAESRISYLRAYLAKTYECPIVNPNYTR